MSPLVFLDCETLGLGLDDPIWEIGLIRREPDGIETEHHFLVAGPDGMPYDAPDDFPEPFASDFQERYHDSDADLTDHDELKVLLRYLLRPVNGIKPHIVGAVPNFDTERIAHQFGVTGWHYHLVDVENLIVGYTYGAGSARFQPPWNSDDLSRTIGIRPEMYDRHTALGDARWARDIYDAITRKDRP